VLAESDEPLAGRGPARRTAWTAPATGRALFEARSSDFDPLLRIERGDGALAAEDEDSGGASAAFVSIDVTLGDALQIVLAAQSAPASGEAQLAVRVLPESAEIRALAAELTANLPTNRAAFAGASRREALDDLRARVERLLVHAETANSWTAQDALKRISAVVNLQGDSATTLRAKRENLRFYEDALPSLSPELAMTRAGIAEAIALERGDLGEARSLAERAVADLRRSFPDTDVRVVKARAALATVLHELGEFRRAANELRAGVRALEADGGGSTPLANVVRGALAIELASLGDWEAARAVQERVVAWFEANTAADSSHRIYAEQQLAETLFVLGDAERARAAFEHHARFREEIAGPDDIPLQGARENLATLYRQLGDLDAALEMLRRVIDVYERKLPPGHAATALARSREAALLGLLGHVDEARELLEQVVPAIVEALPESHPWRALAQGRLARARARTGDYAGALEIVEGSLGVLERNESLQETDWLVRRAHAAWLHLQLGHAERSRELARLAAKDLIGLQHRASLVLAPREAEAVASSWRSIGSQLLELIDSGEPEDVRLAFELVESARGIALDALVASNRLARSADSAHIAELRDRLAAASAAVARAARGSAGSERLQQAVELRERAHIELREAVRASLEGGDRLAETDAERVAHSLRGGELAIGYWIVEGLSDVSRGERASEPRLLAFVVRPDGRVSRHDLGPSSAVDEAVRRFRDACTDPATGAAWRASGEALRALVLDPLLASAPDARLLDVAGDGPLHFVPLDALPLDAGFLGERVAVVWRATLAPLPADRAAESVALVAIGDVDFDVGATPGDSTASLPYGALFRGAKSGRFERLPETALEIQGIAQLFRESHAEPARTELLTRADAGANAVARAASTARYLHIATHGFTVSLDAAHVPTLDDERVRVAPLSLCGIALAGANAPPDEVGAARGILTGEELATLDLSGCELAMLSACSTQLGARIDGQGLASLQRALHAAGARSTVASLWDVPDEATRRWMLAFYRALWVDRESPARALVRAKQALRDERAPPRDWAAWVLSGDGR
jgi:CHAT domain-containing protein